MKNRGSTPILTNLVGVHPRNIQTKFEANACSGSRGEIKTRATLSVAAYARHIYFQLESAV